MHEILTAQSYCVFSVPNNTTHQECYSNNGNDLTRLWNEVLFSFINFLHTLPDSYLNNSLCTRRLIVTNRMTEHSKPRFACIHTSVQRTLGKVWLEVQDLQNFTDSIDESVSCLHSLRRLASPTYMAVAWSLHFLAKWWSKYGLVKSSPVGSQEQWMHCLTCICDSTHQKINSTWSGKMHIENKISVYN